MEGGLVVVGGIGGIGGIGIGMAVGCDDFDFDFG